MMMMMITMTRSYETHCGAMVMIPTHEKDEDFVVGLFNSKKYTMYKTGRISQNYHLYQQQML